MQTEEILYKRPTTGTTVTLFAQDVTNVDIPALEEPACLVFNTYNIPIQLYKFGTGNTMQEIWVRDTVNNYYMHRQLSSITTNYVTGFCATQTYKKILSPSDRATIEQRFQDNVVAAISAVTNAPVYVPTYVFFDQHDIDDLYANIKLNRTYDTLDTLKVYHKTINTIPQQEARTGVLFGKLEAIQTLKDEDGNNIRIPLRNVPIGIFTKTDEFPAPTSLDDNGDRFYLNIKENTAPSQYFDATAYTEDIKYLRSNSNFLSMPEKFKHITITNDEGEFVIYDAPLGNQTVVFEVDLFKQGLTKDEIILNNFPFPADDNVNIGQLPCYYYNQVPVDVIPAWGNSQSGYTELNIKVNLDLRKWATYIFAPVAYGNEKLETTVARNLVNSLKIQIRDIFTVS